MADVDPTAVFTGSVCKIGPKFGFIKCDDPEMADMFLIPQTCHAFNREIPPVGTRLQFTVVTDEKTGRPRAENVEPCVDDSAVQDQDLESLLDPSALSRASGVVASIRGNFGFIKQDNGESDMFCLPPIPPIGTRVVYDVVEDAKTGRPRAENIMVVGTSGRPVSSYTATPPPRPSSQQLSLDQVMEGMSGMSWEQMTSMTFEDVAAQVTPQPAPRVSHYSGGSSHHGGAGSHYGGGADHYRGGGGGRCSGVVASINGSGAFGFIQQDSGGADMFILPPVPPIGTRVSYDVVTDAKTGRPRAENVQEVGGGGRGGKGGYGKAGKGGYGEASFAPIGGFPGQQRSSPYGGGGHAYGGQPARGKGGGGWGRSKGAALALPPMENVSTGTVTKVTGKFGFIQQDSGEADMFVFPPACEAFGRELPPVGTRVQYTVVIDQKTGRPRADMVVPA